MRRRHPDTLVICNHCHRIMGLEYSNSIWKNLDESNKTYEQGRESYLRDHHCRGNNKKIMERQSWEMWKIRVFHKRKAEFPEDMVRETGFKRLKLYATC